MPYENPNKKKFDDEGQENWIDLNRVRHTTSVDPNLNPRDPAKEKEATKSTPYQRWVEEKRREGGRKVLCPRCGAENVDLDFIEGETCVKCGFKIDNALEIQKNTNQWDGEKESYNEKDTPLRHLRLSTRFSESDAASEQVLALPQDFPKEDYPHFEYVFKNATVQSQFFMLVLYSLLTYLMYYFKDFFILRYRKNPDFMDIILLVILAFFWISYGINLVLGFLSLIRITIITANENGVRFSGWWGTVYVPYNEIIAIENERFKKSSSSLFTFNGIVVPSVASGGWHGGGFGFYFPPSGRTTYIIDPDVEPDISTSSSYVNDVCISTVRRDINYSFTGAGNVQFIRALAVIIHMAKRQNSECKIDPSAIKAAEKGGMDFNEWTKGHSLDSYSERF